MKRNTLCGLMGTLSYFTFLCPCFAIDIELVPVGGTGNEIKVRAGDRVELDVFVSDWSSYLLFGIEADLDDATLTNFEGHTLTLFEPDVDEDGICDPGNQAYCSYCSLYTSSNYGIVGIFADDCRDDHLARLCGGCEALWARDPNHWRFAWLIRSHDNAVEDPEDGAYYVGSFVVLVPEDATGDFQVEFSSGETKALDTYARLIEPMNLTGAKIRVVDPRYADVNHDDVISMDDVFCVIDGYKGDHQTCAFDAVDIEPCNRNSLIDIQDIFGVLDAFSGKTDCGSP